MIPGCTAQPRSAWRGHKVLAAVLMALLGFAATTVGAGVLAVRDDAGREIRLATPAQRIVSLAPHITELLFAAGAGARLVGASRHSDFPEAARTIPEVGDAAGFDMERIVALHPDLVVAWQSGNPPRVLERLAELGIPVFVSEPRHIPDIASNIERLGVLAGTAASAQAASAAFRARYQDLRTRHANTVIITVFYQIWDRPLMTVNGAHLISDVIRLCGGVNAFAHLPTLTGVIDREAVLAANPQVIVSPDPHALNAWRAWPQLQAVRRNWLFVLSGALIARHSPRILEGAEQLCTLLQDVRRTNGAGPGGGYLFSCRPCRGEVACVATARRDDRRARSSCAPSRTAGRTAG